MSGRPRLCRRGRLPDAELIEIGATAGCGRRAAFALDAGAPLVWPDLGQQGALRRWRPRQDRRLSASENNHQVRFKQPAGLQLLIWASVGHWRMARRRGAFVLTTGCRRIRCRTSLPNQVLGTTVKTAVITPDVGGFGPKAPVYREHALVLEAASACKTKSKGRRSHRAFPDRRARATMVNRRNGDGCGWPVPALRVDLVANLAPTFPKGHSSPIAQHIDRCYTSGTSCSITGVTPNTVPVDAYRGAGRPEAAFLVESWSMPAPVTRIAPDGVRRRNSSVRDRVSAAPRPAGSTTSASSKAI